MATSFFYIYIDLYIYIDIDIYINTYIDIYINTNIDIYLTFTLHLQIYGASSRSLERHFFTTMGSTLCDFVVGRLLVPLSVNILWIRIWVWIYIYMYIWS